MNLTISNERCKRAENEFTVLSVSVAVETNSVANPVSAMGESV